MALTWAESAALTDQYNKTTATILGYHQLGIAVLNLHGIKDGACRCQDGAKCTSAGKHPVNKNWSKEPIRDARTIKIYWENPNVYNVGLLTGETFWVLDVDPDSGGSESLAKLEAEHGTLDPQWVAKTPRGGLHYFFACTPETAPGNKVGWMPGIDIRGVGGQVAAYPSVTPAGKYVWHKDKRPFIKTLTPAPTWLLGMLGERTEKKRLDVNTVLSGVPEGQRNDTLFRFACSARGQGVDYELAKIQIKMAAAACNPPMPELEALTILDSAYSRYPAGEPRFTIEVKEDEQRVFNQTDLGNAERLIWRLDGNVKWCHAFGKWLWWDGTIWRVDETGGSVVLLEAARMVRDMPDREWGYKCESRAKLSNCIELAKAQPGVSVSPDDLDRDPMKFAVANGVIDLMTGELCVPDKNDLITQASPVAYVPGAECPRFEQFLYEVFKSDEELLDFINVAFGYTLTGLTSEHCLFFCFGGGANGKSTLLDVLSHMMGGYGRSIPADEFNLNNTNMESTLARLKGARYIRCSETSNGRVAEATIKMVTGGDPIQARMKYGHPFEFSPISKSWWAGNQKPRIVGTDDGIWRRIRLVPFEAQFTKGQRDPDLGKKLRAEASGILNYALQGLAYYLANGMPESVKVTEWTDEYRGEMDTIAQFIDAECEEGSSYEVASQTLYNQYSNWCKSSGHHAMSITSFSSQLTSKGYEKIHTKTGKKWLGIQVREYSQTNANYWQKDD